MILEHTAKVARKVRGTDVKVGDPLYAIYRHTQKWGRLFFVWTYTDKEMAEWVDTRLPTAEGIDDREHSANWRRTIDELTPTNTKRK